MAILAVTLAARPVAASAPAPSPAPWTRLPSGLHARVLRAGGTPDLPTEVHLVRLDPRRHDLRLVIPSAEAAAAGPRVAPVVAAASGALALVNASYFDAEGRPLGLLVSGGRVLQAVNSRGWAWAGVTPEGTLVVREASVPPPRGLAEACQAGPLLVQGGAPRRLTSTKAARRAFVGADAEGRLVVGATNGPLTLAALARLLARPEPDGGAGLVAALNLDGGSSSQLYVEGGTPPLAVAGVPVPAFLGAFPRDARPGP